MGKEQTMSADGSLSYRVQLAFLRRLKTKQDASEFLLKQEAQSIADAVVSGQKPSVDLYRAAKKELYFLLQISKDFSLAMRDGENYANEVLGKDADSKQ
jgi:hypothetical protein